ncbi:hypothetical protein mRhiFer1_009861 [Rhinolophus ferrumequinum]|uniref:Uncharacterized protein n=1 Tax=Rhinolophus ferrumequinum TaxID=59479 RepID=A0A7J7YRT5_RHIFE|nr:hypothetical protein mRhiFer1_009861 [Rhinolophus ferrumequinum]
MQGCLLAPAQESPIPCLRPSSHPPPFLFSLLTFLLPPVLILFLPVTLCFPQSLSGPDKVINRPGPFLPETTNFPGQSQCHSTRLLQSRWHQQNKVTWKEISHALSLSPPPLYLLSFFSLLLSHSAFLNVAIEEVTPIATFAFAFGFRHPEGKWWPSEGEGPTIYCHQEL